MGYVSMEDKTIQKQSIEFFRIPLLKGNRSVLVFESLPITKKDVEVIKKWIEVFSENLTETKPEATPERKHERDEV